MGEGGLYNHPVYLQLPMCIAAASHSALCGLAETSARLRLLGAMTRDVWAVADVTHDSLSL